MRRPHLKLVTMGFRPARRPRRRTGPAPTEQQLREQAVERAFQCGARYSHSRWRRRAPPRMALVSYRDPGYELLRLQQQAFFRGYDAATRARYAHARAWDAPWDAGQLRRAAHG